MHVCVWDCCLWGALKNRIYVNNPRSLQKLKDNSQYFMSKAPSHLPNMF
jgi:hypothetical protein